MIIVARVLGLMEWESEGNYISSKLYFTLLYLCYNRRIKLFQGVYDCVIK